MQSAIMTGIHGNGWIIDRACQDSRESSGSFNKGDGKWTEKAILSEQLLYDLFDHDDRWEEEDNMHDNITCTSSPALKY